MAFATWLVCQSDGSAFGTNREDIARFYACDDEVLVVNMEDGSVMPVQTQDDAGFRDAEGYDKPDPLKTDDQFPAPVTPTEL